MCKVYLNTGLYKHIILILFTHVDITHGRIILLFKVVIQLFSIYNIDIYIHMYSIHSIKELA